jgi:hypothetical protein
MIFSAPAVAHPVVVAHHLTPSIAAAAYQYLPLLREPCPQGSDSKIAPVTPQHLPTWHHHSADVSI